MDYSVLLWSFWSSGTGAIPVLPPSMMIRHRIFLWRRCSGDLCAKPKTSSQSTCVRSFLPFQIVHFFFRGVQALLSRCSQASKASVGTICIYEFRLAVGGEIRFGRVLLYMRCSIGCDEHFPASFTGKYSLDAENVFSPMFWIDFYCVCTPRGIIFAAWADRQPFRFSSLSVTASPKSQQSLLLSSGVGDGLSLRQCTRSWRGSEKESVYFWFWFFCGAKITGNFGAYIVTLMLGKTFSILSSSHKRVFLIFAAWFKLKQYSI